MNGWRLFWSALGAIVAFAAAFGAFTFWAYLRSMPVKPASNGVELGQGYDVISIQLEILTVAVTAFGIFLGVAAIVGYQSIKSAAETRAESVATKTLAEHIEKLEDWKRGFNPSTPQTPDPGQVTEVHGERQSDGGTSSIAGSNSEPPA